jgi:hypothetical protein
MPSVTIIFINVFIRDIFRGISNLNSFAVIHVLHYETNREDISIYRGKKSCSVIMLL